MNQYDSFRNVLIQTLEKEYHMNLRSTGYEMNIKNRTFLNIKKSLTYCSFGHCSSLVTLDPVTVC